MAAAALVLGLLAIWELYVRVRDVDELLLPAPSAVATSLYEDAHILLPDLAVTAGEAVLGLLASLVVGVAIALAMHLYAPVRKALEPLVVGSQAIPIVVVAPSLILLLGFGIAPKVVVVALVCFFPITMNLYDGLASAEPDQHKLMRALHAGRWQTLRWLDLPAALPQAFTGLRIAAAVAVIGAVFAEWTGSSEGLGHLLLTAGGQLETARVFAATFLLFALAIALYLAVALVERRIVTWKEPKMNRFVIIAGAALTLALAGCGEKEAPAGASGAGPRDQLTLVLDYFPNADHAGIYAAQAAGDFAAAGLDVKIQTPPDPSAPLKLLQAGRADLAVSYEPELLLARDKGAQLVSVAAMVQKPLTSLISLKGVREAKDLEGAKVGTAGIPYQSAYLKAIAAKAGVEDYEEINVGFNLTPAMLSGKVDATLGSFWNYEGTDLERRGRKPTILRMEELGVPTYNELILVSRREDLDRAGASKVRRFLRALARGHERLREDPAAAVDALLEANGDLERGLQAAVVERTLPVFFPEDESKPWGYQEPSDWLAYGAWMRENGLLEGDSQGDAALTNEFLPGQGLEQEPTEY